MSCVVGYNYKSHIYMAYDSIEYSADDATYRTTSMDKCFIKGNMLFGIVGSIRAVSLIKYKFKIPPKGKIEDDQEYLSTVFIDSLIKVLEKNDCLAKSEDEGRMSNCNLLIGYNKKLYEMFQDFYIGEIIDPPYEAIGANCSYALGSMHSLHYNEIYKPEEKLLMSLEAVKKFSTTICNPFKILRI